MTDKHPPAPHDEAPKYRDDEIVQALRWRKKFEVVYDGAGRTHWECRHDEDDKLCQQAANRIELLEAVTRTCCNNQTALSETVPTIKDMVDRFLGWPLPKDFSPDCGIKFTPFNHPHGWPIGTNLFTADQAKQMFEYALKNAAPQVEPQHAPARDAVGKPPAESAPVASETAPKESMERLWAVVRLQAEGSDWRRDADETLYEWAERTLKMRATPKGDASSPWLMRRDDGSEWVTSDVYTDEEIHNSRFLSKPVRRASFSEQNVSSEREQSQ